LGRNIQEYKQEPDNPKEPSTIKRLYLLDGSTNKDIQLQCLDLEVALWIAAEQFHQQREVVDGDMTWVVVDQMFLELYWFYS